MAVRIQTRYRHGDAVRLGPGVVDLISQVRIAPGIRGLNRFDPRRLTIIWKV
jgi:hypothetical protein